MGKIVRLTESDLIRIVKRVISEEYDSVDNFLKRYSNKYPMYKELEEYIKKGCINFKIAGKYIVYDVGAPYDFVDAGFEREDAVKVKNKLRNKGFISLGVGQFAKEM